MSKKGYIRLHRQLQECWVWNGERYSRGQAWVDLILMANHKDVKMPIGENIEIIKRGQFVTSISKLADKWMWSFNTVKKFLNLLENDNMLTRKSDNSKTVITIINYELYQYSGDENEDNVDRPLDRPTDRPTNGQGNEQGANRVTDTLIPNNNDNNDNKCIKNDKENIYSVHFEEFWKAYPRKKEKAKAYKCYKTRLKEGFSEDELLESAKKYAEECKKLNTEESYIKHAATFIGPNTPFIDYLKGDSENATDTTGTTKTGERKFTEEELEYYERALSDVQGSRLFD